MEMQKGQFPPTRVSWDYKKIAKFPEDKRDVRYTL